LRLELVNGARVISLPSTEATVRGFSAVSTLICDECARIPDSLIFAVLPMLFVSQGRLLCLSTAGAKMGYFYKTWTEGGPEWDRYRVPAADCPRIPADELARQRRELGPLWAGMELDCEFGELLGALFREEDIAATLANDLEPLFGA
jgi:hypothetical protein